MFIGIGSHRREFENPMLPFAKQGGELESPRIRCTQTKWRKKGESKDSQLFATLSLA
jgi:hypothetical protein